MTSLFICRSPLQALIAEEIIRKELPNTDVHLIYLVYNASKKHRYYFDRLSKRCNHSSFHVVSRRYPFFFIELDKILNKDVSYDNVFFAAIDNVQIHHILSRIKKSKISTFDDGTANIIYNGGYYSQPLSTKIKALFKSPFYRLYGCKYNFNKVKKQSSTHYTLYVGRNIIDNTVLLSLDNTKLSQLQESKIKNNGSCILFLGTVYDEIVGNKKHAGVLVSKVSDYISKLRNKSKIYYLPHPRDNNNYFDLELVDNYEYLVAEDVVLDLLKSYSTVTLLGFSSSAQFNFLECERIKNKIFKSDLITFKYDGVNEFMAAHCDEVVDLSRL